MNTSMQVLVTGPLEPYASGYRADLDRRGYSSWTVRSYLFGMAGVSRWLATEGLAPAELDAEHIAEFLDQWRAGRQLSRRTPRGLNCLLGYLRGLEVVPALGVRVSMDPADQLVAQFVQFLREERALAAGTVRWYAHVAELFLSGRVCQFEDLARLTGADINAFVLAQSRLRRSGSLNNLVTGLRALLSFFYLRGYTPVSLAAAAPSSVGWRDRRTSADLTAAQVAQLLASCDQSTRTGCRDFAILTVLVRLGLRANEIATLQVDDIDWRAGEITVHGKGHRFDRLPLPVDVGQAIADYCHRARPRVACRSLFLHTRAPYGTLTASAVSYVVVRSCRRAGLALVGAHRLRHAAAAAMRRAGAPLIEISQVLRHAHAVTTVGYAREDLEALADIARPWPGGAA